MKISISGGDSRLHCTQHRRKEKGEVGWVCVWFVGLKLPWMAVCGDAVLDHGQIRSKGVNGVGVAVSEQNRWPSVWEIRSMRLVRLSCQS